VSSNFVRSMVVCACVAAVPFAASATSIEAKRIAFAKGASSATVKGSIRGDRIVDYKLGARAGQTMSVTLETSNPSNYFNVLPPGSETAIFVGSTSGNDWSGVLPADGAYTVRVYLMRSAARRNESASYTLTTAIAGAPARAGPPGDAKVPGTPYHATGEIPCVASGQARGSCRFGVVREGGGSGIVTLTKPDGRSRAVFFDKGKVTGYDASQSDRGGFSAERQGDTTTVRIGDEIYEIPDAVIFGG